MTTNEFDRPLLRSLWTSKIIKKLERAGGKQLIPTQKFVVEKAEEPLAPGEIDKAKARANTLEAEYEVIVHPAVG
jgi:hypothetical protein